MSSFVKLIQVLFLIIISCGRASVLPSPRRARLTIAEPSRHYYHNNIDGNPETYSYGFDISDPVTGNAQYRTEERHSNGTVTGSYGYVDPSGRPHRYRYIADHHGYRVMQDKIPAFQPKPAFIQAMPRPINSPQESSITWARPQKHNKKKQNKPDRNKNKWNHTNKQNHFIQPPSYYASLY